MEKIKLSEGAGGEMMQKMISEIILSNLENKNVNGGIGLDELDDGATIPLGKSEIVVTTDSHTIDPIFFPGGDIGKLAVSGTVNDLAVMGAKPLAIASALVISEGFPKKDLKRIIKSMNKTCKEVGISIITGDTKVIEKNKFDDIIITTTGIGIAKNGEIKPDSGLEVGDKIILSGTVGDHGMAIMAHREGFGFETNLKSDVAPVWDVVEAALNVGGVKAMKDPTRGGLANALNEMASKSGVGMLIYENKIPIKEEVVAASEMLGIDPYEVANEGKVIIGVESDLAEDVLEAVKKTKHGKDAEIIGEVTDDKHVVLKTSVGGKRILETPVADPVPRVC